MWQVYALTALDLANERARAAWHEADVERLVADRPSFVRTLTARALRVLSEAAVVLSNASASAARSVEGRPG